MPILNLETVQEHPCQAVGDIMTMQGEPGAPWRERRLTLAWCEPSGAESPWARRHSILTLAASALGMDITIAHPLGFDARRSPCSMQARRLAGAGQLAARLRVVNDLREGATRDAEVLYARSWGSTKYWHDTERESMIKRSLQSWQIDDSILQHSANALFMNPLPVRRNVAVTDSVLDGPRSVVYDQAANRVPVQKALLLDYLG